MQEEPPETVAADSLKKNTHTSNTVAHDQCQRQTLGLMHQKSDSFFKDIAKDYMFENQCIINTVLQTKWGELKQVIGNPFPFS